MAIRFSRAACGADSVMQIARGPALDIRSGRRATAIESFKPEVPGGEYICRRLIDNENGTTTLIGYACDPSREGRKVQVVMRNELSSVEKAVCAKQGISEAEFLAQKARNGVAQMSASLDPTSAPRARLLPQIAGLSDADRNVIRMTRVDPRDYSAMKSGIGIGARTREFEEAMRDVARSTPADDVRDAIKELQTFLRNPTDLEALQPLVNADGFLSTAMRKVGAQRRSASGYY
jgi:hypothetical protein